ncbi:unnamed protein product, partial [Nippostrongylus brasiliensis]|uniref:Ubiquitin carboxyl-terminal hydrolase (inferred by orthology to a S. mansoni protein) n=1 Tax=Nippostrongylus brasiliensis TaxID=27835 RepID=A0A0N4XFP2_NIPBR
MTADGATSSVLTPCEHRTKKSLFKSKEVRKKLKSCKKLCEECERSIKNGLAVEQNDQIFICVSCGCLTCEAHAKKHCNAPRTGEKHPLLLNLDSCLMRCEACDTQLIPLDEPQDLVRLFCNEYRSFLKTKAEPRGYRTAPESSPATNGVVSSGVVKLESTQDTVDAEDSRKTDRKGVKRRESIKSRPNGVVYTECMIPAKPASIVVPSETTPLNNVLRGFIAEFHCGASPSPGPVFSQISCKTPRFKGYQQQDAHELLRYLLDGLRSEELERYKSGIASFFGVSPKMNRKQVEPEVAMQAKDEAVNGAEPVPADDEDDQYSDEEIDRLAAGVNRLDFTKVLVRPPEEYTDGGCSIGSCLLEFTAAEQLQGVNAYECENCCVPRNKKMKAVGCHKKRVRALKRYLIYEPPAVLTLHLKRFQQLEGMSGRTSTRKLSGHVSFPLMFDMAPFCCKNVEAHAFMESARSTCADSLSAQIATD